MNLTTVKNLFQLEEHYTIGRSYFNATITESIRFKLVTWMLEICEEETLTDLIYSQSVSIFDRLMIKLQSQQQIDRINLEHVQLIGCVCLLIASKLNAATNKLNAVKLADYTDGVIRVDELLEWEVFVLDVLNWDVAGVCANDYLDYFVEFIVQGARCTSESVNLLKKHTYAYTALCSTNFKCSFYPSSMIASACLLTAAEFLKLSTNGLFTPLLDLLSETASIDIECLLNLKELVVNLVNSTTESVNYSSSSSSAATSDIKFEDDYDFDVDYMGTLEDNLYQYSPSSSSIESIHSTSGSTKSTNKKKKNKSTKKSSSSSKKSQYRNITNTQYCSYYIITPPQPNTLPLPTF